LSSRKHISTVVRSDFFSRVTASFIPQSQLYQQTEVLPNPVEAFNESAIDDFSVRFTIGKEVCSDLVESKNYCNGPLPAYTKFGLIARLFTENGYRDTQPIYLQITPSPLELLSPKTIVAGCVGSLLIFSLLLLVCCTWCSKTKKKPTKEKEAAEADENLLSFTSYCVIDKNPLPRKSYDD
jgi:hypothetical protein